MALTISFTGNCDSAAIVIEQSFYKVRKPIILIQCFRNFFSNVLLLIATVIYFMVLLQGLEAVFNHFQEKLFHTGHCVSARKGTKIQKYCTA